MTRGQDSDHTAHEADEDFVMDFTNDIVDDNDDDDTSNEPVSRAKAKLLREDHTPPLPDAQRKKLKRSIKYGIFLSGLDPKLEIPLLLHKSFAEHKLRTGSKGIKSKKFKTTFESMHETCVCGTMQYNCMYGDERVNHTILWSSLLDRAAKEEKPDWILKNMLIQNGKN